ncbi:hypothetical protein KBJ94_29430 [Pseudomonas sp. ITA]|uniref:hypothetical protein n=1 Tax=Pseudomonas sp. ITA TaxID=2825841 RepID=UPI002497F083|nr:hypothetical protein [Pseudomonas sp. ITA]MDI2146173.1 hypothetical protein [Pseudomonas sp. ITA]
MSEIKAIELEFAGQPITDEELAVQLENCLRSGDSELLNHIARSVVQSHFPQISSDLCQGKRLTLLTFSQVWQRLSVPLTADFKNRMDSYLGALRQWRQAKRH